MEIDPFVTFIGLCIGRWAFSLWQGDATREAIWFASVMILAALWMLSMEISA